MSAASSSSRLPAERPTDRPHTPTRSQSSGTNYLAYDHHVLSRWVAENFGGTRLAERLPDPVRFDLSDELRMVAASPDAETLHRRAGTIFGKYQNRQLSHWEMAKRLSSIDTGLGRLALSRDGQREIPALPDSSVFTDSAVAATAVAPTVLADLDQLRAAERARNLAESLSSNRLPRPTPPRVSALEAMVGAVLDCETHLVQRVEDPSRVRPYLTTDTPRADAPMPMLPEGERTQPVDGEMLRAIIAATGQHPVPARGTSDNW